MNQSRRMLILQAVVEDYIRSQEPVGSTTLARDHNLGVSSATIRNDMAALEDEGYLIQPHTSAGRVPTERGYRYFVDRLSSVVPLSSAQRRGIVTFLSGSVSLQDALKRAAKLLASITGQVAVVSAPSLSRSRLRRLEIVPLAHATFLAVIITDAGSVAQHTLSVDPVPPESDVMRLAEHINASCLNAPLAQAGLHIRRLAQTPHMRQVRSMALVLAHTIESMAADEQQQSEMYTAGTSRLAKRQASDDLGPLFDALEEQVVLMQLMRNLSEEERDVNVAIGSETHTPGLMNAAVVSGGYGRDEASAPVAFVGSIGPKHMDYAATITAVRAVARYLSRLVSQGEDEIRDVSPASPLT